MYDEIVHRHHFSAPTNLVQSMNVFTDVIVEVLILSPEGFVIPIKPNSQATTPGLIYNVRL